MYQSVAHTVCGGQGLVCGPGHPTLPHEPR